MTSGVSHRSVDWIRWLTGSRRSRCTDAYVKSSQTKHLMILIDGQSSPRLNLKASHAGKSKYRSCTCSTTKT